ASSYDYHQTVAGLNGDYHYRGESDNVTLQLSRLLHRNASQKTTFTYYVLTRSSKNYINDSHLAFLLYPNSVAVDWLRTVLLSWLRR
ncbi:hypothetical protein B4902_14345, partial [Yersinia frederiksenii]